ncbi:cytochrome P450 [Sphingomonas paeninsulae]|uniref:Cytochrome P450 n=1 Tax=Sphingomonas paeninsulae TaxID=2319844 RepID=A0A494TGE1_SPHPE|nr:cytochrome P450 [Sphingomonas paeninsulae]AYJ86362.1 cytochrome P450 [Sphingomonas paeninsulae]
MATIAAGVGQSAEPRAFDPTAIDPLDVTRAELFRDHSWPEPFRRLRAEAPVYYCENSKFGPYWSVSTYKPIVHIEALPKIFSSSWEYGGITVAGDTNSVLEAEVRMPMFIAMDPPKHQAQRRTVAPAFTPSEIERMRIETQARTGAVLDSLPIGQAFDWVDKVSIELTTGMLAKLFDYPWATRHDLTRWSDVLGDVELFSTLEKRQFRLGNAFEMGTAFKALWDAKASQPPANDLISVMLNSDAMAHMDEGEFMGNLILLIVGGNDTTRNSMTGLAYGLDKFPAERAKLENDPSLIVNTASEIIRWQTPLSHMRRTAMEDAEVEGQMIRKGDKLALWYVSANRDESVFDDGDAIRVDRENARRHLSFGYGIHRCVGARVAELQLIVLMEEMAKRRLRVNVLAEPERVAACFVNEYKSMQVELSRY